MKPKLILAFAFFALNASSQNTVGLISFKKDKSYDGYQILYPHNQPNVFLMNNCGEIAHQWTDDEQWRPGNAAYVTPQGKLVKAKRNKNITADKIWAPGGGATIEIRDWDNKLEWTFTINDSIRRLHHDVKVMPNGNILAIVWNKKTREQYTAAGRDTSKFKEPFILSEQIIEINPSTNQVVWQWDLWDHIIQDYDATKPNYGVIKDNPHKFNINYAYEGAGASWIHINAIDFNPQLNQILASCPTHSEFWIIDHTTTTAEAATGKGGQSTIGGDFMYRWGNAATYGKGQDNAKDLFFQHNVHWLEEFLPLTHPKAGMISAFNNRFTPTASKITQLRTPWDMYEWKYTKLANGTWGPDVEEVGIQHPIPTKMRSTLVSSTQILPNNNLLVLAGVQGYAFELTPDNEIVWEYITPLKLGAPVAQGTTGLVDQDNLTFRTTRYPASYAAFVGKDLSRKGFIEATPNVDYCQKLVGTTAVESAKLDIYPNPSRDMVTIISPVQSKANIVSASGQIIESIQLVEGVNSYQNGHLAIGLYYVVLENIGIVKAFNKM